MCAQNKRYVPLLMVRPSTYARPLASLSVRLTNRIDHLIPRDVLVSLIEDCVLLWNSKLFQ